jgi:hypothetical protein
MNRISADQAKLEQHLRYPNSQSEISSQFEYSGTDGEACFRDIDFNGTISIKYYQSYKSIKFVNCIFETDITVDEPKSNTTETRNFRFENCNTSLFSIQSAQPGLTVEFFNNKFIGKINIEAHVDKLSIYQKDYSEQLCCSIEIENIKGNTSQKIEVFLSDLKLDELSILSCNSVSLILKNIICSSIDVSEVGSSEIKISNCEIAELAIADYGGNVSMYKSSFDLVSFDGVAKHSTIPLLVVSGIYANNFSLINGLQIQEAIFNQENLINCLEFGTAEFEDVLVIESIIDKFVIPVGLTEFNHLKISGLSDHEVHINHLYIPFGNTQTGRTNKKLDITLEAISLTSLSIGSFVNKSNFFCSEVTHSEKKGSFESVDLSSEFISDLYFNRIFVSSDNPNAPTISIENSDLGKAIFIACDFSQMQMRIQSSKISEIFLAGTEMPKNLTGNHKDQQIGYAQLKKVYENRGDSVKYLDYLSLELTAHYADIKQIPRNERSKEQRRDLFILSLNKFSNNFGTSYGRWKFAFLSMAVLFILHNFTLGYSIDLSPNKASLCTFFEILSLFPEFIYPIHKPDFIAQTVGLEVTSLSRLIDVFARIFSGYFIYQFIQVFRKYGKK